VSPGSSTLAPNVVAALFAVVAGVVFLLFAALHLRRRPTFVHGRTITLACALVVLFPLFIQPIQELIRGALLRETDAWPSVLRLVLFVVVTVGVAWYFRGWLLFNVDTSVLGDLLRESCQAIGLACRSADPKGKGKRFRLGEEERELRIRREPGSRFASLYVRSHRGLPWLEGLAGELGRRSAEVRSGRYYSRAAIFLIIGLTCLGLAVILLLSERLGLVVSPPTTFYP